MFATAAKALPPDDDNWAYEVKWDGVRTIAFVENGAVCLQSRNVLDVTNQYPELAPLSVALGDRSVVLDGEIVAPDEHGLPQFGRLQQRMHVANPSASRMAEFAIS